MFSVRFFFFFFVSVNFLHGFAVMCNLKIKTSSSLNIMLIIAVGLFIFLVIFTPNENIMGWTVENFVRPKRNKHKRSGKFLFFPSSSFVTLSLGVFSFWSININNKTILVCRRERRPERNSKSFSPNKTVKLKQLL